MHKTEEIADLERRIIQVFKKDVITPMDVKESKKLLEKWKFLSGYVSDKTPVMLQTIDEIVDKQPNWQTKTKNHENN
jgi:hypothetical protein